MKYVNYDKNTGRIIGYYDDTIHQNIPKPNIPISEKQWQEAINNNYNFIDVTNNTFGKKDFRTLEELKTSLVNSLKSKIQSKITGGFTFGSDTIKTDLIAQNNGNANYQLAMDAINQAKDWKTNTAYDPKNIILVDGTYYITFNGGITGSDKSTFPTDFQEYVTDNEVKWAKLGLLVGTDNGNKFFEPQEVKDMYVDFNMMKTDWLLKYDEYKTKIEAVTSIKELDTLKTEIEGL